MKKMLYFVLISKEISQVTGGFTESSANIASSFKKAVLASENYYLLNYTPSKLKIDGRYREIKVKVKGGKYKIFHRGGYIAD